MISDEDAHTSNALAARLQRELNADGVFVLVLGGDSTGCAASLPAHLLPRLALILQVAAAEVMRDAAGLCECEDCLAERTKACSESN